MIDDPGEEFCVDVFSEGISGVDGVHLGERLNVHLSCSLQLAVTQPVGHVLIGHPQQLTEHSQVTVVGLKLHQFEYIVG